jgi:hypothetical protein
MFLLWASTSTSEACPRPALSSPLDRRPHSPAIVAPALSSPRNPRRQPPTLFCNPTIPTTATQIAAPGSLSPRPRPLPRSPAIVAPALSSPRNPRRPCSALSSPKITAPARVDWVPSPHYLHGLCVRDNPISARYPMKARPPPPPLSCNPRCLNLDRRPCSRSSPTPSMEGKAAMPAWIWV